MADAALTPELALRRLGEFSTDVRAAAVLDADLRVAAQTGFDDGAAGDLSHLAEDLLDRADAADAGPPAEIEVSTPGGTVFAVRGDGRTIVVVAGRLALSAVMRYDLRHLLGRMAGAPA